MDLSLRFFTRNVSQANVQAETSTHSQIHVRPPAVLELSPGFLLRVNRPLYALLEAGLHWYRAYHKYLVETLNLNPTTHYSCFLYTKDGMSPDAKSRTSARGFTCLQPDDTASAGNETFLSHESRLAKRFDRKPTSKGTDGSRIKFNGADISLKNSSYTLSVVDHLSRLEEGGEINVEISEFITQRAIGAYFATVGRPDLDLGFSLASRVVSPDKNSAVLLNKHIREENQNKEKFLLFSKLDDKTIRIALFSGASFASISDLISQIEYVVVLVDHHGNVNILHHSSVKFKRVTRIVLAAEMFAAFHAFDFSSTLRATVNYIFWRLIPLISNTDSHSLFDCIVGLSSTTEKRLLINLGMLRQSYEHRELNEVVWIPIVHNPADVVTRKVILAH